MSEVKLATRQPSQPSVQSLLDELRPILSGVTKASIRRVGIHGCALRASVAKSFEFAEFVHHDLPLDHGFFDDVSAPRDLRGSDCTELRGAIESSRTKRGRVALDGEERCGWDRGTEHLLQIDSPMATGSPASTRNVDGHGNTVAHVGAYTRLDGEAAMAVRVVHGQRTFLGATLFIYLCGHVKMGPLQSVNSVENGLGRGIR